MKISEALALKEETKIPVIEGYVTKVCEPKMEGEKFPANVQNIYISSGLKEVGNTIKVKLRSGKHHITEEIVGRLITIQAGKLNDGKSKGKITGITVKQFKNASFVVVTDSAEMAIDEPSADVEDDKEEELKEHRKAVEEEVIEAEGPSDDLIRRIINERCYINKIIARELGISEEECLQQLHQRLPELATSIHITLDRAGQGILPTKKHVERVKKLAEAKGSHLNEKDGWRNFYHEKAEKKLGQYARAELIEKFGPWYYKSDFNRFTKDSFQAKCHSALGEAMKEFEYSVTQCFLDCAKKEANLDEDDANAYLIKRFKLKDSSKLLEKHAKEALESAKETFEEMRNLDKE